MKKSFPVNLNNTIFYIDEDAYNLLTSYFDQLRSAFSDETVADIESRVGELMTERVGKNTIITLPMVNEVIAIMGSPEQLGATPDMTADENNVNSDPIQNQNPPYLYNTPKKLYRDIDNKVLGGVLAGLAARYDWNLNILRLLVIFLALITGIIPVMIIYMTAWMVIPAAVTTRQRLEMRGEPVSVETVSQSVNAESATRDSSPADTLGCIINFAAKCALGFAGLIAALIGGGTAIGAIICLLTALGYAFGSPEWMEYTFNVHCGPNPVAQLTGMLSALIAVIIPCIAVIWAACVVFFKSKGASRTMTIAGVVIEICSIVAAIILISAAEGGVARYC